MNENNAGDVQDPAEPYEVGTDTDTTPAAEKPVEVNVTAPSDSGQDLDAVKESGDEDDSTEENVAEESTPDVDVNVEVDTDPQTAGTGNSGEHYQSPKPVTTDETEGTGTSAGQATPAERTDSMQADGNSSQSYQSPKSFS